MTRFTGETVIYGTVVDVAVDIAELQLLSGTMFLIEIMTFELSEELKGRIGTEVGLNGIADWDMSTRDMMAFRAKSLTPYEGKLSAREALEALAVASNGRWDNVDPDEFIRNLRGDEFCGRFGE